MLAKRKKKTHFLSLSLIFLLHFLIELAHEHQVLKKLEKTSIGAPDGSIGAGTVELLRKYHLGHGLHILDALITATAIEADLPMLTYNTKDFRFFEDLDLI